MSKECSTGYPESVRKGWCGLWEGTSPWSHGLLQSMRIRGEQFLSPKSPTDLGESDYFIVEVTIYNNETLLDTVTHVSRL